MDFGVNVTIESGDPAYRAAALDRLAELGARRIRLELDWYSPERDAATAAFAREAAARGFEVLGLLTGLVPGTLRSLLGDGRFRHPLDELDAFLAWVGDWLERAGESIRAWEVWNEQNSRRFWLRAADPAEYFRVLEATAKLIRDRRPGDQIVLGSLCGDDVHFLAPGIPRGYLRPLLESGAAELVDAIGIHPYTPSCYASLAGEEATLRGILRRVEAFDEAYPELTRPVWVTEIGISRTWVRLGGAAIGRLYARLMRALEPRGIPVYLWCLNDFNKPIYGPGNPEKAFGLTDARLRLNATGQALIAALKSSV